MLEGKRDQDMLVVKCHNCGQRSTGDDCQWCGYSLKGRSHGKKFFLIIAVVVALVLSGGSYAYTWTSTNTAINATPCDGDFGSYRLVTNGQPDWGSVLPTLGPVGIEILRPDHTGDENGIPLQQQCPPDGVHWDKVDEEVSDEWETYVYNGGSFKYDLYHLPNRSKGSGIINGITVYFRFAGDFHSKANYTGYATAVIKTYSMVYYGSEESQTGKTFVTKSYTWITNPYTNSAWTWDEINELQIGVGLKAQTGSRFAYCTQVYVAVKGEGPPIICGGVPTGDLFEVSCNECYPGDIQVEVYLINIVALNKAYQALNIKLYLDGSVEAGQMPDYQLLTLNNRVATFHLEDCATGGPYTLSVIGDSYCLTSDDSSEWASGWSVTPEFFCDIEQR